MRPRPRPGATAVVSLALLAVNALGYLLTLLAARVLVPAVFGELSAVLGIAVVATVPAGALQTVVALRTASRAPEPIDGRRLHLLGLVTAGATASTIVLASPLLAVVLALEVTPLLVVAAVLAPTTLVAAYDGLLQGAGRMSRLALLTFGVGAAKNLGGVAGLLVAGTPTAALVGMAAGTAAGTAATWVACGRPGLAAGIGAPGRDVRRAAGSVLGFVVLWNLDLLLARALLPAGEAGLYAVGAVLFKIAFWLPQGIGVVTLPRLADARDRPAALARALLLLVGLATPLVLATALAGPAIVALLCGGDACRPVGADGWLFALLGTLMAAGQLLVWSGIARHDHRTTATVWLVAGAEGAAAAALAGAGVLSVRTLCLVATAAAVLLLGSEIRRGCAGAPA